MSSGVVLSNHIGLTILKNWESLLANQYNRKADGCDHCSTVHGLNGWMMEHGDTKQQHWVDNVAIVDFTHESDFCGCREMVGLTAKLGSCIHPL